MRLANGYVYFTKKEEREIFRCYYIAVERARFDGQRKNLEYVRRYLIDGVGTIRTSIWENFIEVVIQLGIDMSSLGNAIHQSKTHPGKGASYRIPNKTKDPVGNMKALAKRRSWRNDFKANYGNEYEVDDVTPVLRVVGGVG